MNPNQIFARPVVEPWKPVTLPDILGDLFGVQLLPQSTPLFQTILLSVAGTPLCGT